MNPSSFSRKNTPNSEKHPKFANRLANRPFFQSLVWFAEATPEGTNLRNKKLIFEAKESLKRCLG